MYRRRKFAYLTPANEGGSTICRPLHIPDTFVHIVTGALATLTEPWNYQQVVPGALTPERCTEIMAAMLDQYLLAECDQAAPPYWSLPAEGDIDDTSDADELYPWYDQAADWIIQGFLANNNFPYRLR